LEILWITILWETVYSLVSEYDSNPKILNQWYHTKHLLIFRRPRSTDIFVFSLLVRAFAAASYLLAGRAKAQKLPDLLSINYFIDSAGMRFDRVVCFVVA